VPYQKRWADLKGDWKARAKRVAEALRKGPPATRGGKKEGKRGKEVQDSELDV